MPYVGEVGNDAWDQYDIDFCYQYVCAATLPEEFPTHLRSPARVA